MKYIITEQQLTTITKRFNKELADRGELGHVMEELVLNFIKSPICDVVAIKIPKSSEYIILILTPNYHSNETESRIAKHIENFIGVNPQVIINKSDNCMENTVE